MDIGPVGIKAPSISRLIIPKFTLTNQVYNIIIPPTVTSGSKGLYQGTKGIKAFIYLKKEGCTTLCAYQIFVCRSDIIFLLLFNLKHSDLKAFLKGRAIRLKEVGDGVFSEGVMGDGIAIIPEDNVLYAPCHKMILDKSGILYFF